MKKINLTIAAAAITALLSSNALAAFPDVASTHTNVDAINHMQRAKIIEGYPDGSYQPDRQINRAEFTKIIVGAYFTADEINKCDTSKLTFPDTSKDTWYSPYVCLAVEEGIIDGYPDGTFKPGDQINFVESAKIILEASTTGTYNDTIWYKPYVEGLESEKAIPTTITKFDHEITRGEMAEMIYRLLENITTKTSLTYADLDKIANPPANEYDPTSVKIDDKVGDFKVTEITRAADITTVKFENEVEITGEYTYHADDTALKNKVCLDNFTTESASKLPTLNATQTGFFCFENETEAQKEFAPLGSTGTTTVVIDEYVKSAVNAGDPIDYAKLVKVIDKKQTAGGVVNLPQPGQPNGPVIMLANEFDVLVKKVGESVMNFKITSIGLADQNALLSNTNAIIEFEGEAEISGHFQQTDPNSPIFPDTVCIGQLDTNSQNTIPYLTGNDPSKIIICFNNKQVAKSAIANKYDQGTATLKVKDLTLNQGTLQNTYSAEFVSISEKQPYATIADPFQPTIFEPIPVITQ